MPFETRYTKPDSANNSYSITSVLLLTHLDYSSSSPWRTMKNLSLRSLHALLWWWNVRALACLAGRGEATIGTFGTGLSRWSLWARNSFGSWLGRVIARSRFFMGGRIGSAAVAFGIVGRRRLLMHRRLEMLSRHCESGGWRLWWML